jgi:hypothetical protein
MLGNTNFVVVLAILSNFLNEKSFCSNCLDYKKNTHIFVMNLIAMNYQ